MSESKIKVGLFVTCLVDIFRPSVGFAAVKLLEDAGCTVEVPEMQTCCGQPAYNSGDRKTSKEIAERTIRAFEPYEYVVAPSGSCAGMLKKHYPTLFGEGTGVQSRAIALADKTHELVSFLTDVLEVKSVDAQFGRRVT
ncbi:MAG: (Fe-S)-binding protein, partial [Rhizobiales bacterium]|nr:(Fe-S)-binding protein [Hyphomicrobiales bacterium]